jgi:vesicle-fusing ATPase
LESQVGAGVDTSNIENLKVNRADFMNALTEVKPAYGVSEDEFDQCTTGGIIRFSRNIENVLDEGRLFVEQVRTSEKTPLVSVLLHGPPGSGKTALAASIAMASDFPFIKLISPESMVGFNEMSKVNYLTRVFMDAYKSPLNIVVIDNIERILDWVPVGPRFSNAVLQTLLVLLRKAPPKGRRLLIIATTTERSVLNQMDMLNAFDSQVPVPNVANHEELKIVLRELNVFNADDTQRVLTDLEESTRSRELNVGVKKILMAVETARQDRDPAARFSSAMSTAVIDMMGPTQY